MSDLPVSDSNPISEEEVASNVQSLVAVENIIKSKFAQIDDLRKEGGTYKEMIDSFLENDDEYSELDLAAREAAKAKTAKKKNLLENPAIKPTVDKYKENKTQLKELRQSLSVNLAEFQRLSGTSEIELEGGDLRQIVYTAKLVRRSQQD